MDPENQENSANEVKSLVLTSGHNVKVGLANYSSEDVYEGAKLVIPITGDITPEKVQELHKTYAPIVEGMVHEQVQKRAQKVREDNGITPKIDAASIVAGA